MNIYHLNTEEIEAELGRNDISIEKINQLDLMIKTQKRLQKNLLTFFSKKFLNFLTIANCIMDWLIF
jgi:hypothetical protein